MSDTAQKLTPLMQQYLEIKANYPDTLLFFQVGDFYELFFEDAKQASSFLAIALTKRGKCNGEDIPLCGVPVHAMRHYLIKLVKGGFRVAICDQLAEPKPGSIVERGVTQVITPGTLTDEAMLDHAKASYVLSFFAHDGNWGLLFGELLTAQLFATSIPAGNYRSLEAELARFFPDEIVMPAAHDREAAALFKQLGYWVTQYGDAGHDYSLNSVQHALAPETVARMSNQLVLQKSVGQFFAYLAAIQHQAIDQFRTVQFYQPDDYLLLDAATQRNLELVKNSRDGGREHTLLAVMDKARTSMGSRVVRKWLLRPLVQKKAILERQEAVGCIKQHVDLLENVGTVLSAIGDLERVVGRIALRRASLADYVHLRNGLKQIPVLQHVLVPAPAKLLQFIREKLIDTRALVHVLDASISDDADSPYIIKKGFDAALDQIRDVLEHGQQRMLELEVREIEHTGIASLKIKYNKITGYAFEITNANKALIPERYIHQQTLSNRARFVTSELLALEKEITDAQGSVRQLEDQVYERVKDHVYEYLMHLRHIAHALSYLDALYSFAQVAYDYGYVAPVFHDQQDIIIHAGRHPVVEQTLSLAFVPNDTLLTAQEAVWVITGPNMGGKSTYLRQVALMCIMAQCGSFIPAASATLPILDRVFTRIGAGDSLAEGKSTFFVEMEETALITRQATSRSLVILDEVGRGTSTYDGLAIAQAVIEYIVTAIGARCLFATHYHELTKLSSTHPTVANYHVLCEQTAQGVLFLHRMVRGAAQGSFGLEVARLAQVPLAIVSRAQSILQSINAHEAHTTGILPAVHSDTTNEHALQATITQLTQRVQAHEALARMLNELNLDELSPRAAYDLLWQLKMKQ